MINIKSKAMSFIAEKAIASYISKNYGNCNLTINNLDLDAHNGLVTASANIKIEVTEEEIKRIIEKAMGI